MIGWLVFASGVCVLAVALWPALLAVDVWLVTAFILLALLGRLFAVEVRREGRVGLQFCWLGGPVALLFAERIHEYRRPDYFLYAPLGTSDGVLYRSCRDCESFEVRWWPFAAPIRNGTRYASRLEWVGFTRAWGAR